MYDVSVIIPVYNAEKYLSECVDSILNQTLKNIEIILVDDGSIDNSPQICDEYAGNYDNVVVVHCENGGPSKARNIGISIAKGDYLGFVDSDDTVHNQMYEILLNSTNNKSYDIVVSDYYEVIGLEKQRYRGSHEYGLYEGECIISCILSQFYSSHFITLGNLWNKIYKKDFICSNNLMIDENLIRAEDFWFNFDCFELAKSVNYIDEALYYYKQDNNPNSIMKQVRKSQIQDWKDTRQKLVSRNKYGFDVNCAEFFGNFVYSVAFYIKALYKMKENKKADSIIRDEYFKETLQYKYHFSLQLDVILFFIEHKMYHSAKLLYKIWNLL